jgi:hypothetical protein
MATTIIAEGLCQLVTDTDLEYIEGREAWLAAGADAANPHVLGTLDHVAWEAGYLSAQGYAVIRFSEDDPRCGAHRPDHTLIGTYREGAEAWRACAADAQVEAA